MRAGLVVGIVAAVLAGVPLDAQIHPEMVGREALLCADAVLDYLTDQPYQASPAPVFHSGLTPLRGALRPHGAGEGEDCSRRADLGSR